MKSPLCVGKGVRTERAWKKSKPRIRQRTTLSSSNTTSRHECATVSFYEPMSTTLGVRADTRSFSVARRTTRVGNDSLMIHRRWPGMVTPLSCKTYGVATPLRASSHGNSGTGTRRRRLRMGMTPSSGPPGYLGQTVKSASGVTQMMAGTDGWPSHLTLQA